MYYYFVALPLVSNTTIFLVSNTIGNLTAQKRACTKLMTLSSLLSKAPTVFVPRV